jgi:outer membrane protein assembly factor BamA
VRILPVVATAVGLILPVIQDTWASDAPAPVDPAPVPFDPTRGIGPEGQMPRIDIPADLPNADRWRYIPEGRILPGNMCERFLVTSFATPLVYYASEVGFGGGLAITDIDFRNQRRQEFAGIRVGYTTEGQQSYAINWRRWLHQQDLPAGGVIQEERSFLQVSAGYEKSLTLRFFGLGPETTEDDETSYSDAETRLGARVHLSFPDPGGDWIVSYGARLEGHNLGHGWVSGDPDTLDAYPALFAEGDGYLGGWLSAGLRYDTRDSPHNPYVGWTAGVSAEAPVVQSGLGPGAVLTADASLVLAVPGLFHGGGDPGEENPPTDTVAVGGFLSATAGDMPFWALPTLGGTDTLRGYIGHRWTDRADWHAGAEYRFWWMPRGFAVTDSIRVERLGSALFYDIGTVAGTVPDLLDAPVHSSYGVSLRISLERMALFRFDVGFSDEGINYTGGYGLSF